MELQQKNTIKRFYVLDTFRGLAAILVFLYHMPNLSILTNNLFITNSGYFVDLFFILSGFVIYHNYKDTLVDFSSSKIFLKKRFKRLIPLHLYTLFLMLALELMKFPLKSFLPFGEAPFSQNTIPSFFSQLFLLNSTPLFMGFNWNGANWSISAEIISYILFVILTIFWVKNTLKLIITSLIIIALGYFFYYIKFDSHDLLVDFNFSFIRAIIGFLSGIIIYKIQPLCASFFNKQHALLINFIEISAVSFVIYCICYLSNITLILNISFALIILFFSFEKGLLSSFLKKEIFQKLGTWSYSIYLNHLFVIAVYKMIFIKIVKPEGFLRILIEMLVIFIVCYYSSLTYKFVEKRFYNIKKSY